MNTLAMDGIYLEFGMQRVLSGIYLKCYTGRITGLLGRNGSGKSCLMKIGTGVMQADCKSVRYNEKPLLGNYLKQKIIGYLPQENMVPPFLTFGQALEFYKIDFRTLEHSFPELKIFYPQKPSEVSGGQRRLLEVLMVVCSTHPFCFLDEPFSGLSPLQVERLIEILQQQKERKGILITDHLHRSVTSCADDLYLLKDGSTYQVDRDEQLAKLGYLPESIV